MNIKVYNLGIYELSGQLITTRGRRQEIHKPNGEQVIMCSEPVKPHCVNSPRRLINPATTLYKLLTWKILNLLLWNFLLIVHKDYKTFLYFRKDGGCMLVINILTFEKKPWRNIQDKETSESVITGKSALFIWKQIYFIGSEMKKYELTFSG